jgi:alkylation response protein AidB-like acyl-CoA dehydrogenase
VELALDDRHDELRRIARQLFHARSSLAEVRALEEDEIGYSRPLWREMAALDWIGLGQPETHGGSGGALMDVVMIYLEMGRALVPSPHLASAVICGSTLVGEGNPARADLQASLFSGDVILAPALFEATPVYSPARAAVRARSVAGGFRLEGTKVLVPYLHGAQQLLVSASVDSPDAISLFLVDAGRGQLMNERLPNIAGYPLSAVTFDGVEVDDEALVGELGRGWELLGPALERATVLRCAEIAGAGERVLEMSVDYAQHRRQFGRPIGQFQAVQYLCSDIAIATHLTSLLTFEAAWQIDQGLPSTGDVAMAKSYGGRAAQEIVHRAHEVHAGVGFMMEADLQLYTRRAKHWEFDLGDARYHDEAIARVLEEAFV